MNLRIAASASPGEVRIAVLRDGHLLDYAIWRPGAPDGVGDTFHGRVTARVPAMAGVFVALNGATGFLPDGEGGAGLREGDPVAICVTRAAQGGKGPRLSARLETGVAIPSQGPGPLLELAERFPDAPIAVDDAALAARLRGSLADRLNLRAAVFDAAIEDDVAALAEPVAGLPNGGRIHIEPTSALVAIDIDAGAAVDVQQGKTAAHFTANRSALSVLARQIRLRNLSGAILVDFAGLRARRRTALAPALQAALAEDPLHPRLLGFTALGLAEIVRPRVHPPLHEMLVGPHAAGLAALRQIAADPTRRLALRAAPAVVAALHADTEALPDLAHRLGRALILRSDPGLAVTEWRIETDG